MQMRFTEPIRIGSRACTIRPAGLDQNGIRAVAEELSRDSVIVLTCIDPGAAWIQAGSKVVVTLDLPFRGNFTPRALEVAAVINHVISYGVNLRVAAVVREMTFVSRDGSSSGPVTLN